MLKKISFLLALGFIAINAGACAQRMGYSGGPTMSSGYDGGYQGRPMMNASPCPLGGDFDQDAGKCIISGGPTPSIADDPHCRGVAPGTPFDVPVRGPHGELGVDHRVCGVSRRG